MNDDPAMKTALKSVRARLADDELMTKLGFEILARAAAENPNLKLMDDTFFKKLEREGDVAIDPFTRGLIMAAISDHFDLKQFKTRKKTRLAASKLLARAASMLVNEDAPVAKWIGQYADQLIEELPGPYDNFRTNSNFYARRCALRLTEIYQAAGGRIKFSTDSRKQYWDPFSQFLMTIYDAMHPELRSRSAKAFVEVAQKELSAAVGNSAKAAKRKSH